jgi:hypothetical protein
MTRETFYTSEIANSLEVVKRGIQALMEAAKNRTARTAWIVCSSKGNLTGLIEGVIGGPAVKALQKGLQVELFKNCSLVFYHERAIPSSAEGSPVLVCFPDEALMQKIDSVRDLPILIVLPWVLENIKPWLLARGARDLLAKTDVNPSKISNPVVERALASMLAMINVSTGIVHPSDKSAAIEVFKTLRAAKEQYDPMEVGAWFVQKGMDSKHASDIVSVANDPAAFRSSSRTGNWGAKALERWRSEAKNT